ncbi:MAG: tripartite tricarboxylate transporter TctB family protein [Deltaproteobacteria bacterium]|nr:tripartite tricarboxylate transporter TctB family protein [Deltaproteobacteria bacterium]
MKLDRITGIFFSILGVAVVLSVSLSYPLGTLHEPGGGFFPLIGSVLLLGLSLLLTCQSFAKKKDPEESAEAPFFPSRETPWRILSVFVALLGYRYLLPVIGFAPITGIFIFFLARFLGHFGWTTSVIFGVATAVVSYYLFQVVLKVPMPVPMIYS